MKVVKVKRYNDIQYLDHVVITNFTGIVIDEVNFIAFYKNSLISRKDGMAAIYYYRNHGEWWYKSKWFGSNSNAFTIKSWKRKIKEIDRKEKLKIFK